MKYLWFLTAFLLFTGPAAVVFPQAPDTFEGLVEKIEQLYFAEKHKEAITLIRNSLDKTEFAERSSVLEAFPRPIQCHRHLSTKGWEIRRR